MISSQVISKIDVFAGLHEALLATIAGLCEGVSYLAGQRLFCEGERAGRLFLLQEGQVALQVQITSRQENLTVTVVNSPGQSIGLSAVVPPHHYTASALCQTDCHLLAINGLELRQALEQEPAGGFVVMQRITELISGRLRSSRAALLRTYEKQRGYEESAGEISAYKLLV